MWALKNIRKSRFLSIFGVICKSGVLLDPIWLNAREGCARAVDIFGPYIDPVWLLAREGGSGIGEILVLFLIQAGCMPEKAAPQHTVECWSFS